MGENGVKRKAVSFMAWAVLKKHHFELFLISIIFPLHNQTDLPPKANESQ